MKRHFTYSALGTGLQRATCFLSLKTTFLTGVMLVGTFSASNADWNSQNFVPMPPAAYAQSGLVALWRADGNTNDSSGKGHNGLIVGVVDYATGVSGSAFSLSGEAGYVSVPDSAALAFGGDFTIGFWFNGNPGAAFIGQDEGPFATNKWFVGVSGSQLHFHTNSSDGSQNRWLLSNTVTVSPNIWHQAALTREGRDYRFYFDGMLAGESINVPGIVPDPDAPLKIGYAEPGYGYTGLIDDIVIYNRALNATELQTLVPEPGSCMLILSGICAFHMFKRGRGRATSR